MYSTNNNSNKMMRCIATRYSWSHEMHIWRTAQISGHCSDESLQACVSKVDLQWTMPYSQSADWVFTGRWWIVRVITLVQSTISLIPSR